MAGITLHALMEEDGLFVQYVVLWGAFLIIGSHWFSLNEKIVSKKFKGENKLE